MGRLPVPAQTVVFHGTATLRPGQNVFWLSVRIKRTADLAGRVATTCVEVQTSQGTAARHNAGAKPSHWRRDFTSG